MEKENIQIKLKTKTEVMFYSDVAKSNCFRCMWLQIWKQFIVFPKMSLPETRNEQKAQ